MIAIGMFPTSTCQAQALEPLAVLERQTFLDNRDFAWYVDNIPFFECPDPELEATYYYRWELITKHLTYGSPDTGYVFTEFIDRPFWSGAYGAISCPAGHQLYEARWLRSPTIANDYSKYWLSTPGAQPRNYSTWLADSILAVDAVHPNPKYCSELLDGLIENFEGWKKRHYDADVGLFWQTGHDDGMEFNIASRQTQDILRGAPSYRPSFNAYMWADARAISELARRAGKTQVADQYREFAEQLRSTMLAKLWDPKRQFFLAMFRNTENRDGYEIPARTLIYEAGRFAGDSHGRELIGYVPWQFNMLPELDPFDDPFDAAWIPLMRRDGFYADYGPTTVERNDPMFLLQKSCCWWSGQSWPYATTQTLKALANRLQLGPSKHVTPENYVDLLGIYSRSHRKQGRPYLAEALHPDTGSFEGHDGYNHSEHYFHSGFCDLVITGLVGIRPSSSDTIEVHPLAPASWDYFALDGVRLQGHDVTILWDRDGDRYQYGAGCTILVDGAVAMRQKSLQPMFLKLPGPPIDRTASERAATVGRSWVNFAVNNDGNPFPSLRASSTQPGTSISKLQDGNYWYVQHPPNRWESAAASSETSTTANDQPIDLELDFGIPRDISEVRLLALDDEEDRDGSIAAPQSITIARWDGDKWLELALWSEDQVVSHRPTILKDLNGSTTKLRFTLQPRAKRRVGLTEIECWGWAQRPIVPAPPPVGNLAYRAPGASLPVATASHSDRFGGVPGNAIDGKTIFTPTPLNRWTSYESKSDEDWLEIQLRQEETVRRVELAIYDDRGGVQPPASYRIEWWDGNVWKSAVEEVHTPELPVGSAWNVARFQPFQSDRLRIVFRHKPPAKSGVSEVSVWSD